METNILKQISNKTPIGVYSVCTANYRVIKSSIEFAKKNNSILVVEATANQVNQFGGYTGMTPEDFKVFVHSICDEVDYSKDKIILGGDHLGPLTWTHLDEEEAMKNAEKLVYQYVYAGYTKIHLDTSMKLSTDINENDFNDEVIANRSARLAKASLQAYNDRLKAFPHSVFPVFIIGSEVPIPGGSQEKEESISVTKPEDFINTYKTFKKTFNDQGLSKVFDNVIAIVVQPGVEFGDDDLFIYNREEASTLVSTLKNEFKNLSFEGHSTDYQPPQKLREMVEDGISILKVGPALTFAYREVLFALSYIEDILVDNPSSFIKKLDNAMLEQPNNWSSHYHGSKKEIQLKRKFSYSDRCRYYLPIDEVDTAINTLITNLEDIDIPDTLLSQFLPRQYHKIKEQKIDRSIDSIISDHIQSYLEPYEYATDSSKLK